MSINDPILEALSFTLENDLNILTQPGSSSSSTRHSTATNVTTVKQVTGTSGNNEPCCSTSGNAKNTENFVKSSVLLGQEGPTMCPLPGCAFITNKNISSGDKNERGEMLTHLLEIHNLVIDRCDEIAHLSNYLTYWKTRFSTAPLKDFCIGFDIEAPPEEEKQESKGACGGVGVSATADVKKPAATNDTDELYFMLSPTLPEDNVLRQALWNKRLNTVLEINRQEREEQSFNRRCLFCRDFIPKTRPLYFKHMRDNHGFHIGHPDNLIFVKELLQLLEIKLNKLICLFCEHLFKDKATLKEHMRKKQHRKINPNNQEYDKFYMVNYLEPGKSWQILHLEDKEDEKKEDDWLEAPDDKGRKVVCLFCKSAKSDFKSVLEHMKNEHCFDFSALTSEFDFYQKVKLTNYIRRTVYRNMCLSCENAFDDATLLLKHISEHKIQDQVALLPKPGNWNQPEYFFPTYEEDEFLTCLDADNTTVEQDAISSEDENNVIPEDLPQIDMRNRDFDLAGFAIRFHNQNS